MVKRQCTLLIGWSRTVRDLAARELCAGVTFQCVPCMNVNRERTGNDNTCDRMAKTEYVLSAGVSKLQ